MTTLYEVHGARRIEGQLVGRTHTIPADGPKEATAHYLALYADQDPEVMFVRESPTAHPKGLIMADVEFGFAQVVQCPECGQMELWTIGEVNDHGQCRLRYDPCPVCEAS